MEIELYSKIQDPLSAADRMGEMFARSGMFGCEKVEQGKVLALICMVERKSPVAITTNYDIVEGKLRKKALAALADFRAAGGKHKWLRSGDEPVAKEDDRYAELELIDRENIKIVYRYSMADARLEGLVKPKSRWEKRPGNMLRARCISNGLGMLCPEIFAGEDEESDFTPKQNEPLLREKNEAIPVQAEVVSKTPKTEPKAKEPIKDETTPTPSEPVQKAFSVDDIAVDPVTDRLTVAAMGALENAIGEKNMPNAILWLKAKGWISDTLSELSVDRAKRILVRPAEFIGHISKGK